MLLPAEGKAYDFAAVTKKSKIAVESTEALIRNILPDGEIKLHGSRVVISVF